MDYQKLFDYFSKEHGIILIEQEMQEVINIVDEIQNEAKAEFIRNIYEKQILNTKLR